MVHLDLNEKDQHIINNYSWTSEKQNLQISKKLVILLAYPFGYGMR